MAKFVCREQILPRKQNGPSDSVAEGFYLRTGIPPLVIIQVAYAPFIEG
jgi:hypothetical protein